MECERPREGHPNQPDAAGRVYRNRKCLAIRTTPVDDLRHRRDNPRVPRQSFTTNPCAAISSRSMI